jgi:hypothetical protein
MEDDLTAYQRGNRDGLISFAKWAMKMYEETMKEAETQELLACEHLVLERENIRRMIIGVRYKAHAWKYAADKALSMSNALPIDPEGEDL